jgi:hypothetical protein
MAYAAGSWVVPLAQPKMGLIHYLLGRTRYPDNEWTRSRDGSPMRPYDMATDTLFEFMGVRVDPAGGALPSDLRRLDADLKPAGKIARGEAGYLLDTRLNDSFRAVNLLLDKGVAVRRVDSTGDFVVAQAPQPVVDSVAQEPTPSWSRMTLTYDSIVISAARAAQSARSMILMWSAAIGQMKPGLYFRGRHPGTRPTG